MSERDGFRRGTNYNWKIGRPDPRAELAAALTMTADRSAKCAQGEHDEAVAEPRRVTYIQGRRVATGTRYCRWCSLIITEGDGPVS